MFSNKKKPNNTKAFKKHQKKNPKENKGKAVRPKNDDNRWGFGRSEDKK